MLLHAEDTLSGKHKLHVPTLFKSFATDEAPKAPEKLLNCDHWYHRDCLMTQVSNPPFDDDKKRCASKDHSKAVAKASERLGEQTATKTRAGRSPRLHLIR
jgi:hypothetical protein